MILLIFTPYSPPPPPGVVNIDFSYLLFDEVFYSHYYLQNELLHDSIPLIWK